MKYRITLVKSLIARKPNQVATVKALADAAREAGLEF